MTNLRPFKARGRTFRIVETTDARRRDVKNRTLTLQDQADGRVYCFYQAADFSRKVAALPLCVRIYTTAREILEAMLRSAIGDDEIEQAFDFGAAAPAEAGPAPEVLHLSTLRMPPPPASGEDGVFKYRFDGDVLVVTVLSKEFKLNEARRYAELVFERLKKRTSRLVVDLAEVTFMNSSGISVLARSSAEFHLKLARLSDHVRNVMDVMGLLAVIPVYETPEEAVTAFGPPEPSARN
ncbi:MAG: STAS domain-containing protein [Planctomycetales bacterium]|nr:STAS domain-containing protein [Planctomycetales bacterium]